MVEIFGTIEEIYYTAIAVIGVPVNVLAIVILSRGKCGLSTCTTRYLVAMAVADLLVIVVEVIVGRVKYFYQPGSFLLITPVCAVIIVLSRAATDCSVWFTVTFTFDRFVAICCQKLKTKYCSDRTAAAILGTTGLLLCLKNIPFYFVVEPREIVDNTPLFCDIKTTYYTEAGWVGFDWLDTILNPLLPFALILLPNVLTVRHILVASRARNRLRGQSKGDKGSDPEMESRKRSIVLLFTISGSFMLVWSVYVLEFLYYMFTGANRNNYSDSLYTFAQTGYMLRNLSCCTNTFIYVVTQSKFRVQLINALKYPVTSLIQRINKRSRHS